MASALERSLRPRRAGVPTSGTQYFNDTGRGMSVDYFSQVPPAAQVAATSRPADNLNPGFSTPAASEYETPGAGFTTTPTETGFGQGSLSSSDAASISSYAGLAGLLGAATGNQELGQAAGAVNAVTGATQGQYGGVGSMLGGQMFGQTGALVGGLAGQAASDKGLSAPGAINALGGYALSGYGLTNSALSLATSPTFGGDKSVSIGDMIANFDLASNLGYGRYGPVDATQGAMTINQSQDPLGAFMGVKGFDVSGNTQAAVDAANALAAMNNTNNGGYQGMSNTNTNQDTSSSTPAMSGGFSDSGGGYTSDAGQDSGSSGAFGGGFSDSGSSSDSSSSDSSYADGGMIGERPGITKRYADGGPLLAMGFADGGRIAMGAVPSNASVNDRVNAILRNPKMRETIVARAQQLMDSGELTPEEVMTMGRVAEAAMFNPSLYPQLRQFVASQGMTPLPAAYDPSVVTKIIAVSRALQQSTPAGQVPPTTAAAVSPPTPGMRQGGMIHGPGTGRSDSIGTINESTGEPVRVANGEYIIPEHVVRVKGREFFDNLLRRYADVPKES